MLRAFVGAVAAAVAMFVLGFLFYATPLQKLAVGSLDDMQAAAVQQSLAANLPATGTYFVPAADTPAQSTMYSQGPVATVHYNARGFAVSDPGVLIGGIVHMLFVAVLMAGGLFELSKHVRGFADRLKLFLIGVVAAAIFMRLGEPVWYHFDWAHAIYAFIADTISLALGGFIILKLLPRTAAVAEPGAASSAGPEV
jgi:hypothetical protein